MSWMSCKICGFQSKHPDGRGLHKHVHDVHKMSAWDYYQLFVDALQQRIEANVDRVAHVRGMRKCWVFRGRPTLAGLRGSNRRGAGYRDMRIAGAPTTKVHRLSVFAYTGYMPPPSEVVLHQCDNPGCCNPGHVYAGSQEANVRDRDLKDRTCRGLAHPGALLSHDQVVQIRQQRDWRTNRELADEIGVNIDVIRHASAGRTYQDVKEAEILW